MKGRLCDQRSMASSRRGISPSGPFGIIASVLSAAQPMGPGLVSDINNVYGICRVGRDPASRLWATLYIVFGINSCPSSGNSLQYVWAPIMRHPHVDLPNQQVHLLISPEIWFTVQVESPEQRRNWSISSTDSLVMMSCETHVVPCHFVDYSFFYKCHYRGIIRSIIKKEPFYILTKQHI